MTSPTPAAEPAAEPPESAAVELAETDACRVEMVDGSPVRVRGSGDWTDEDRSAFEVIVRAARKKLRDDACLHLSGCDGQSHQIQCNEVFYAPKPRRGSATWRSGWSDRTNLTAHPTQDRA